MLAHPGVEVARDLLHYKATAALVAVGWVRIGVAAFGRRVRHSGAATPSWDAAWFIPVYAWGLESLRHAAWWMFDGGFFPYQPAFLAHGEFSVAVLAGVTGMCMVQERAARRVGLPARALQLTVPVPVFAAVVGVLAAWFACNIMWMPIQ